MTTTPPSPPADKAEIVRALGLIAQPGQVVELRALEVSTPTYRAPHTFSGYFDDWAKLAEAAGAAAPCAKSVYITLNPVNPALLARAANRARPVGKSDPTTADHDITGRLWLPIDLDPVRPSGISADGPEHAAAQAKARMIAEYLAGLGWPGLIRADSGNGAHLLARVDLPADDGGLIERVLKALAARFDDDRVKVDQGIFNPARIWKLYGTPARKGDHTQDRPHRLARLIDVPDTLAIVGRDLLDALAAQAPSQPTKTTTTAASRQYSGPAFDLDAWIAQHGLDVDDPEDWKGNGRRWIFKVCPWNSEHTDGSAFIGQLPSGAITAGCHHNGCAGKTWADLRELYDPAAQRRKARPAVVIGAETQQLNGAAQPDDGADQGAAATAGSGRPTIIVNGKQLRELTAEALEALRLANDPPVLFARSGNLARVKVDERGRPMIEPVADDMLRERLAEVANFFAEKVTPDGTVVYKPTPPPTDAVKNILAASAWPFPALDSIIECPALRPDGTVIDRPGYDAATGLYYHPTAGLAVDPVPSEPTADDVRRASSLLWEAIGDFPYQDDAAKANALAAYLTPIIRPAVGGRVPLALIDAPNAGTGKSLLAETIWTTATGRGAAMMTAPRDSDEWRKRITSSLAAGAPIIVIDNLNGPLFSGELAAVLTVPVWTDRILGKSENVTLPNNAFWLATGNNIRLGGDIPRRCFWIRLDAKLSRPWQRTGFQHADLAGWVSANRGRLIAAGLTLARAWYAAGRPDGGAPTIGGFGAWSRVLGGVLTFAGVPDFLGNLQAMYESADDDGPQWEAFLLALHETHGREAVTVAEICADLTQAEDLRDLVPDLLGDVLSDKGEIKAAFRKRLGRAFASRQGTRYGDSQARVESRPSDTHKKVSRWSFACSRDVCGVCGKSGVFSGRFNPEYVKTPQPVTTTTGAQRPKQTPHSPQTPQPDDLDDLMAGEL